VRQPPAANNPRLSNNCLLSLRSSSFSGNDFVRRQCWPGCYGNERTLHCQQQQQQKQQQQR